MKEEKMYPHRFLVPAMAVFCVMFMIPTIISVYYSMTVWNFDSARFCGLDNYKMFLTDPSLSIGIKNTLIYSVLTSGSKVILAFLIALFLCGKIRSKTYIRSAVFFPNLVSTIAVGATFASLMHPTKGLINHVLEFFSISGINWLGDGDIALYSVILVDIWKGLSIATVIYIAGIQSIDTTYYEAAQIDGANVWQRIRYITLPLSASSRNSVIILSFIGGIRSFDLIWAMTGGGPGYATDTLASIIYKQYTAGYYGLSTAGNVIMLILILVLALPLQNYLYKKEEALQG
ncbi:MAG: sugar ABC transporter permease [Eubacteriales bacterium]|nr:sugar ABC transporter permease [Eubacteriales bacterium]